MVRMFAMVALVVALVTGSFGAASAQEAARDRVLIFSHATGYRHASIEPGIAALRTIVAGEGLDAVASEDPDIFADAALARFAVVVLLHTTTDGTPESEWFRGTRLAAFQAFVARGGAVVAIHSAADSHRHTPWYTRLIGGRFASHPPGTPRGTVLRVDATHPATRDLPERWQRSDEWYDYADVDPASRLLLAIAPDGTGLARANPGPIAWTREVDGGRVFYTGLGHTPESYAEPEFLEHIRGGLRWALRRGAPPAKVIVDAETRRDEPPPHGRLGMSTADRISDSAPHRTMEFRRRVLHPGSAIGVHPIGHDEVYHVERGRGLLTADGRETELRAGMTAYLYDGSRVGIRQVGEEPLSMIVSYPIPR